MGTVRGTLLALLTATLVLAGCASNDTRAEEDGDGRSRLATTVAPITSIVANVAGDRARVTGIVPEGANSHTFEPKPSVAELLSTVDVAFLNGLHLEEPTKALIEANLKPGATLVELGDRVLPAEDRIYDDVFPQEEGRPNPHLWTSPRYGVAYADVVADVLAEHDPDNAAAYSRNLDAFRRLVDEFEAAMRTALGTVPPSRRKLLTYHDSFAYFAEHYGWQVIGAIQMQDLQDPTPREVVRLIEQVRAERVPAIFGSEVFPSPVLERIGEETGARYVDVLRDDDLPGEPGDAEHSWLGLLRFDYATITEALGGDPTALRDFDVRNVAPDTAHYPQ